MRKLNVLSVVLFGLMIPSLCSAATDKEKFTTATKYVDFNGEALLYTNTRGIEIFVNEKVPQAVQILTGKDTMNGPKVNALVRSLIKVINVAAFQATASSSIDNGNGTYTAKQFLLLDKNAKSILIDPTAVNKPLDWASLPADTRIAVKGRINLANAWAIIKQEITQTHPLYPEASIALANPMINNIVGELYGDIELLLTGTSLDNWGFKAVLPDPKGQIGALITQSMQGMVKGNIIEFPVNPKLKITIQILKDKIVAVSSSKLLSPQGRKLGTLPIYQKYAKILPKNGVGYVVADLPQELFTTLEKELKAVPEVIELIKIFLKPVSVVSVTTKNADGYLTIAASNFSFAQVQQVSTVLGSFAPAASSLFPAVHSARTKARTVNCTSNLRQLGMGIIMYSHDHNDVLPADLKDIVKQAYIQPAVLKNLIYVGPYEKTKVNQIQRPSSYVIAVCNRTEHKEFLNILFLDGHVETHKVGKQSTLDFLKEQYKLNQKDSDRIAKRLSEAGK